jgi:ABC-2 type transport system ATP-binding protein
MNLSSGNIYFENENNYFVNRKNMSFDYISSNIYHVKQSSEYTPNFTKKDISNIIGRDELLEEQLGLKELLDKDTLEMSGGQKKRMFIYLALISPAQIILFDEVLSELSIDWVERVAFAIIDWKGRCNKIILLVGHGMSDFMVDKNVTSIKLDTNDGITSLIN